MTGRYFGGGGFNVDDQTGNGGGGGSLVARSGRGGRGIARRVSGRTPSTARRRRQNSGPVNRRRVRPVTRRIGGRDSESYGQSHDIYPCGHLLRSRLMWIILDSNVLVILTDRTDPQHAVARSSVRELRRRGENLGFY